ncbi:serine protease [Fibrobacterales bacterium]|nr:serine protease [Fibrobacterales bacterium]
MKTANSILSCFAAAGLFFLACTPTGTPSSTNAATPPQGTVAQVAQPAQTRAATPELESFRYEIADLADKLIPTVVSIQTEATVKVNDFGNIFGDDFFDQFFNFGTPKQQQKPRERKQQGSGSGVIVSSSGRILTNNHVVAGAEQITVSLSDKREFKAKVVGTDEQTDIAVIQIESEVKDLPVATLGNSDALRVGEWVIAIGNPFGLSQTVTKGIVSAKGIHNRGIAGYENFIQTDAAINPGNSGGGLFNLSGELIGINTAILSRSGGFQGIGFAIPVNLANNIMGDLVSSGKVSRGWLGVSIQDLNPSIAKALNLNPAKGALISEVFDGSPAEKSGIKAGDLVRSINGRLLEDANDLRNTVAALRPGENAEFEILREGKILKLKVNIALRDDENLAGISVDSSGKGAGAGTPETAKNEWGVQAAELTKAQRKEVGLADNAGGVFVTAVAEKTPASKAGLKVGDVILSANQKVVSSVAEFNKAFAENGKTMLLLVRRDKGQFYLVLEK